MKNFKKRKLNGFTLVELLVVMAIFTILLVGTMAFVGPVQKIFKNTNETEKTHAYADTAKNYIEDSLKYAEAIRVYQEMPAGTTEEKEVEKYFNTVYKDIIRYNSSTKKAEYVDGTIRVLRLRNSQASASDPSVGQISLHTYRFSGNNKPLRDTSAARPDNENCLSETYFTNQNGSANYLIKYAVGVNTLINETDSSGNIFRVLSNDKANTQLLSTDVNSQKLSISVIASKHEEATKPKTALGNEYTRFGEKTQLVVANLPLMNINSDLLACRYKATKTLAEINAAGTTPQGWVNVLQAVNAPQAFTFTPVDASTSGDYQNLDNDVYFIYSYADEIND